MKIPLLTLLLLLVPLTATGQTVEEGIALYDAGRYDEAISKFKAALEEDPSNDLAAYELALTHHAKGDVTQCQAVLEPRVSRKSRLQSAMYGILGNCYDIGGDPKRAIATYRKGLKVNRDDTQILYNLAVTLAMQGETDEARSLLKKEVTLAPDHASGHLLLARVFDAQNFRVAAVIEYLRFLSLEASGPRAEEAAGRMLDLRGAGVERKDAQNINVTVDPNPRKEEGDYSAFEMMMTLTAAGQFTEESAQLSEFEKKRQQVSMALSMFIEDPAKRRRDYTARQNAPFFRELHARELLDVFSGIAISSLKLEGQDAWVGANEAKIQEYLAHMKR